MVAERQSDTGGMQRATWTEATANECFCSSYWGQTHSFNLHKTGFTETAFVEVYSSACDRHLLDKTGGKGEKRGQERFGEPLWLLFLQTIQGEFVSLMSDMAKVHEPAQQATNTTLNATMSESAGWAELTQKVDVQERACTNRPNVLMWHQKPSIKAHLVSMASKESSWLCKHRISDQTCRGTGALGV